MKCKKCGKTNDENAQVCHKCNSSLNNSREPRHEQDTEITMVLSPVDVEQEYKNLSIVKTEGPSLVVQKGPYVGQTFNLSKEVITLGRDPGSDIFLDDITVSRHHARLEIKDGLVKIIDVGSLNGTYVNQQRIEGQITLKPNDELQIGKFKLVFLS